MVIRFKPAIEHHEPTPIGPCPFPTDFLTAGADVDGFWVDGENWASKPCWCDRCRAEFTRRTGCKEAPSGEGEPDWDEWLAFHRELFIEHVARYAAAVHARKPSCLIVSNWMYTVRQPEAVAAPVDYLSGDFDWAWGADRAAVNLVRIRTFPW